MARSVDVSKRRLWAERLHRFKQGDLTIAAFCAAERVSQPSFYQWRRKLGGPRRPAATRATRQVQARQRAPAGRGRTHAFVPLQIMPAAAATVEIHLPNGARVSLPANNLATLEAALAAVGGLQPAGCTEGEVC